MENVTKELTEQRVRLDMHKDAISRLPKSRGQALAFTALEKGRMYVGEVCRELGKEYPYEATKTATTAEGIQDAVDVSDKGYTIDANEIVALNDIREHLDKETEHFLILVDSLPKAKWSIKKFTQDCAISEAYRGLKETRMWLGIRLGELRDTAK